MPQRLLFWLLDISYDVEGRVPVIKMWGVSEDGRRVLVKDYDFRPYFYVLPKSKVDTSKAMKDIKFAEDPSEPIISVEEVSKKYFGRPVKAVKVTCLLPESVPTYRERIARMDWVEEVLEADVRLHEVHDRQRDKSLRLARSGGRGRGGGRGSQG